MNRFIYLTQIMLRMAGIFAAVCCGLFFWQLRNTARELQFSVRDGDAAIRDVQRRLDDTSQNLNAALIQAGLATDEARRASVEQRQYWSRISQETIALIGDADRTINGLNETQAGVGRDLHGTSQAAEAALQEVAPLLRELQKTTARANVLAGDPNIERSIQSFANSAENLDRTMVSVAGVAHDVQTRIHDMTKPKKWVVTVGEKLLDWAFKAKAFF